MRLPNVTCNIEIYSTINPSEDPKKIETAILNIFPKAKIKISEFSIFYRSKDLHTFEKLYDIIQSKQLQRNYQRQLEKNLEDNHTWFYLNKQAAFVETIVLCEEVEESPLGPIKINLDSLDIDKVIDWLTGINR